MRNEKNVREREVGEDLKTRNIESTKKMPEPRDVCQTARQYITQCIDEASIKYISVKCMLEYRNFSVKFSSSKEQSMTLVHKLFSLSK